MSTIHEMIRGWTQEARDHAIARARQGVFASTIAVELRKFGVHKSRCAVIGLVHRAGERLMGAEGSSDARKLRAANRQRAAKARRAVAVGKGAHLYLVPRAEPLPPAQATDIARVSQKDRDEIEIAVALPDGTHRQTKNHCRWIPAHLDPVKVAQNEPLFCGDQRLRSSSYCEHHTIRSANQSVAYRVPPGPRAERIPTFQDAEAEAS